MSKLKDFVAFQAMIELVKNRKLENKLDEVYAKCKAQENLPKGFSMVPVEDIPITFDDE